MHNVLHSMLLVSILALPSHAGEAFSLVSDGQTATVFVPVGEPDYVRLAAEDLVSDTQKITDRQPHIVRREAECGPASVVLASLNRPDSAALLERLAPRFGDALKGKWEAYRVEAVATPAGPRLLIAGSDERGTMFGLYAFVEQYLGVDPLYYWADRPPKARPTLAWESVQLKAGEPTFRFRGWFVNDEDLLSEFRLDGGERHIDYAYYQHVMSPSVSARVFEAALRLQMNLVIPSSFVDIRNPAEARLIDDATRRGLFVTMHHIEPLGVSGFAFKNYWKDRGETVPFAITKHADKFREIWTDYARRWAKYSPQVIWQLGLRGIGDRPVWVADPGAPKSDEGRGRLISDAMATQWEIIRSVDPRPQPLATTTLWMEGAALHAAGHLKFPEGIAVIFSDNSPGWQLQPDFYDVPRQPGRPYGVYYHHQLWSEGPHLVQAVSPQKTHEILQQVVERGSNYYAILNASNVRPFVLGLDASARMLRDFPAFDPDQFLTAWCQARFGSEARAAEAAYRGHFASFVADAKTNRRALLDGKLLHLGIDESQSLLARLAKQPVSGSKKLKAVPAKDLLKELRPQLERTQLAGADARRIASALQDGDRAFFESNFLAQHKIMLGLLQWAVHVAEASCAMEDQDQNALLQSLKTANDALALIGEGKALATRGEFADWYRGDRKMNCDRLIDLTAKLLAAAKQMP
jgi:hypothetical protein